MATKHGLEMLLSQYYNSPNLKKYISIFIEEFAEVKQAMSDSVKYRYLADSFGVMVDDIAYIVGTERVIYGAKALGYFGFYRDPSAFPAGDDNDPDVGGILKSDYDKDSGDFVRTDLQLKNAIKARITKITGNCDIEQIITYLELVIGRDLDLEIKEGFKRMDYIVHESLSVADKVMLAHMIPRFKPVGITVTLKDNNGVIDLVFSSKDFPPET